MQGFPLFLKVAQELQFGDSCRALKEKRIATCQALSGTGALYVGFRVLQ